jgi:hypothetical protein
LIFILLILDIFSHGVFVLTNRRDIVASGPKVLPYKILLSPLKIPGYLNRTFAFDKTNDLRYRLLGRDGKQNVNMVGHKMPFKNLALFLPCQLSEYLSQMFPEVSKYCLLPILRYPYDVILAFPHCMA